MRHWTRNFRESTTFPLNLTEAILVETVYNNNYYHSAVSNTHSVDNHSTHLSLGLISLKRVYYVK